MEIKQLKAKPIFDEEKCFIESRLNISLPNDCWIVGGATKYIYLDIYSKEYLIKFKVESGGVFILLKDNREKLKGYKQISLDKTLEMERERINQAWNDTIDRTFDFVDTHRDTHYTVSISGGKDSEILYHLWHIVVDRLDYIPNYQFVFFNTTNEVAEVYRYIKERKDIKIINPDVSLMKEIKNNNYLLPTIYKRWCCSKYKEGQSTKIYDTSKPNIQVIGVRKHESAKRANYEFYMDYNFDIKIRGNSSQPKAWSKLCPIVNWKTIDIWLLILCKGYFINQKYKLGWNRVGCSICPFSNSYEDELIKTYYPKAWQRWCNIVEKNYNTYNVTKLNKWSLQEYIDGIWKSPKSRESKWLNQKPTQKNIHELAEFKGISDELALKYWNQTCSLCGKHIIPVANAMFFKYFGRQENQTDDRKRFCHQCLADKLGLTLEEFFTKAEEFQNEGCNLF